MAELTLKELLEAGLHFGHQTHRWNPKMSRYIFGARNGIHIIDLQKTLAAINGLSGTIQNIAENGGTILFVGTKKQGKEAIQTEAANCGMPYVNERWLGGMLTNFQTIRKSIARLEALEKMEEDGTFKYFKKKEIASLQKEKSKLLKSFGGIRHMKSLPQAIFVIDPKKEEISVKEAGKLGIPVIALVDTNTDPDAITHIIPGNDDAIRAIKLICVYAAKNITQGREKYLRVKAEQDEKERLDKEKREQEVQAAQAAKEAAAEQQSAEAAEIPDTELQVDTTLVASKLKAADDAGHVKIAKKPKKVKTQE